MARKLMVEVWWAYEEVVVEKVGCGGQPVDTILDGSQLAGVCVCVYVCFLGWLFLCLRVCVRARVCACVCVCGWVCGCVCLARKLMVEVWWAYEDVVVEKVGCGGQPVDTILDGSQLAGVCGCVCRCV